MSPLAFLTRPERWLKAFQKYGGTISAAPNFAYELCVRKIADKDIRGTGFEQLARGAEWRGASESGNAGAICRALCKLRFSSRGATSGVRAGGGCAGGDCSAAESRAAHRPYRARDVYRARPRRAGAPGDATAIAFVSSGKPHSSARSAHRGCGRQGSERSDRRVSVVSRTFGDERLLSKRGSDRKLVSHWACGERWRICVGEFWRPRLPCGWRNLRHGTREGHHHQRREESLPARSRRAGGARGGNSQGLHRGVRAEG